MGSGGSFTATRMMPPGGDGDASTACVERRTIGSMSDTVKNCAYCIEEIRRAAVVCRYCGRPCLIGVTGPVTMLGFAFCLAPTAEGWAMWHMAVGGEPVDASTDWAELHKKWWVAEQGIRDRGKFPGVFVGGFFPIGNP
jgi:hypothetical protein